MEIQAYVEMLTNLRQKCRTEELTSANEDLITLQNDYGEIIKELEDTKKKLSEIKDENDKLLKQNCDYFSRITMSDKTSNEATNTKNNGGKEKEKGFDRFLNERGEF